jgi:hypothetical protein
MQVGRNVVERPDAEGSQLVDMLAEMHQAGESVCSERRACEGTKACKFANSLPSVLGIPS